LEYMESTLSDNGKQQEYARATTSTIRPRLANHPIAEN
jgi:hypothetical protein